MATPFDFSASTPATIDELWQCYQDAAFWEMRMSAAGSENDKLTSFEATDSGIEIEFQQVVDSTHIPSFVSKIHTGDLPISRKATYNAPEGETINAVSSGEALGGILRVSGTLVCTREGNVTTETVKGTATASVPLIGKKIEKLVIDFLSEAHQRELDTVQDYLNS